MGSESTASAGICVEGQISGGGLGVVRGVKVSDPSREPSCDGNDGNVWRPVWEPHEQGGPVQPYRPGAFASLILMWR